MCFSTVCGSYVRGSLSLVFKKDHVGEVFFEDAVEQNQKIVDKGTGIRLSRCRNETWDLISNEAGLSDQKFH